MINFSFPQSCHSSYQPDSQCFSIMQCFTPLLFFIFLALFMAYVDYITTPFFLKVQVSRQTHE